MLNKKKVIENYKNFLNKEYILSLIDKISFIWFFEWANMPFSIFSFTKCWFDLWLLGIIITLTLYFLLRVFGVQKLTYKKWEYTIPIPDETWTKPMYLLHVSVFSGYFALFVDSQFAFYHFFYFCQTADIIWVFIFLYTIYWFLLTNFFIIFDYSFIPSFSEIKALFKNWSILLKLLIFKIFLIFSIYSFYFGMLDIMKYFFG